MLHVTCYVTCVQVHGSAEAAEAARSPPRWRQLLWLIYDALRRPLLWFFIAVGFLWGELKLEYAAHVASPAAADIRPAKLCSH